MCSSDCFLFILAVLFPPLPVWVKRGICSADSIINIALCMLGFLPGLLHAWYIIAKYPDPLEEVAYGYLRVDQESRHHVYPPHQQPVRSPTGPVYHHPHPAPDRHSNYGSFNVAPASEPLYGHAHAEGSRPPHPPRGEPPSYASVVKGDNKVQHD
ncbi:hypothetical protein FN846DRAFT_779288 [Sphaerosporella brunnea]|uniref:Stress response RCI peptide n=1 Tax=Sphaerosporella brunnea TaxID=1250544 RepID=A0A5J5EV45_9PEZI|nr:hypothetical protein FN846DRAFT_779288 [Sphaerosporella brunnea]